MEEIGVIEASIVVCCMDTMTYTGSSFLCLIRTIMLLLIEDTMGSPGIERQGMTAPPSTHHSTSALLLSYCHLRIHHLPSLWPWL